MCWVISSCLSVHLRRWTDHNCWVRHTTEFSEELLCPRGFTVFKLWTLNCRENHVKPEDMFTFFLTWRTKKVNCGCFWKQRWAKCRTRELTNRLWVWTPVMWLQSRTTEDELSCCFFVVQLDLCEIFITTEKGPGRCYFGCHHTHVLEPKPTF